MVITVLKATYEPDNAILFELDIDGDFSYFAYRANDPYSGAIGLFLTDWIEQYEDQIEPWVDPGPQPYNYQILWLWERLTDEEADEFDGAVTTRLPVRLRRQFALATSMQSDGELFDWVRTILIDLVGETRALAVLAE